MNRLVEHGGLGPGIGSGSPRIDRTATQTSPKGGLEEGCYPTVGHWSRRAHELTDALLGHVHRKFTVVILKRVLMEPMVRGCASLSGVGGELTMS